MPAFYVGAGDLNLGCMLIHYALLLTDPSAVNSCSFLAVAVLELDLQTRLTVDTETCASLCLPSTETEDVPHYTWL